MSVDIDELVEKVKVAVGCVVAREASKTSEAAEFLERVSKLRQDGTKISPIKVANALKEHWDIIVVPSRLSDHLRGNCACRKIK